MMETLLTFIFIISIWAITLHSIHRKFTVLEERLKFSEDRIDRNADTMYRLVDRLVGQNTHKEAEKL